MHAVIGRWTTRPPCDALDRQLRAVLTSTASRPGFVTGCCARDESAGTVHAVVLWEDRDAAHEWKAALEAHRKRAAEIGLLNDFLIVADVLAQSARP